MEEIINRLSKAVATYPIEAKNYPNCIVFREDLENLINKYKEQEKMIELMAEYISIQKWGNTESKESVIHYFRKKAKGE